MDIANSHTAVLFFSRSAQVDADAKTFSDDGRHSKDCQIAQQLIAHTRKEISKTELPYFIIDESQQKGHSFGERFSNAFEEIFDRGFDYVIAVGNDTPGLSKEHIIDTAQKLRSGFDVVLGPSTDGGIWLSGYSKGAFNKKAFKQHPWQTNQLLSAIRQYTNALSVYELPQLGDIDSPQDLNSFINSAPYILRSLATLLLSILSTTLGDINKLPPTRLITFFNKPNALRAPPLV
ncbi:hypothetical protein LX73_1347 [Fodinibius salinus]|uniref:DUF2064 domain-containing protein n=1 Tax=Fodinibius salinus TaxID=860790 RepID=A0A5D3YJE9_9BACT|nr:DUF2064 domain-containing protein [Fodinibius salinus]TYP93638.1 hypothetical protein LX73_1347 [Fodinibius salinus]